MKKGLFFMLALVLITSISAMAQSKRQRTKALIDLTPNSSRVRLGNITANQTTMNAILDNPILITDSIGCKVSGFNITIQTKGHGSIGPFYSNAAEMTDIQKTKIKEWGNKNTTLYIQDIHLNCQGHEAKANSFSLIFDN